MKKYLFINYFRDNDPERRAEYIHCVTKNLALPFLEKVVVFVEDEAFAEDLPESDKLVFVLINQRLEFGAALKYINSCLKEESVAIITNLDIYLEDSEVWANIDKDFFEVGYPNKAMVCCRHNVKEDGTIGIEIDSWMKGEFCDAWIFKTPIDPNFLNEDLRFCVGNAPQCDNVTMHLMSKYYHVYSWGSKYKIFHYDICRKKNTKGMIFNDKTDFRASVRRGELKYISAFQDWEKFLRTSTRPKN